MLQMSKPERFTADKKSQNSFFFKSVKKKPSLCFASDLCVSTRFLRIICARANYHQIQRLGNKVGKRCKQKRCHFFLFDLATSKKFVSVRGSSAENGYRDKRDWTDER